MAPREFMETGLEVIPWEIWFILFHFLVMEAFYGKSVHAKICSYKFFKIALSLHKYI